MTVKNNSEIHGRSLIVKIIIGICILIVVGSLLAGTIALYNDNFFGSTEEVVKVERVFIDVNGDGLQDYVRYAEVVLNKGNLNLTPSP